jgi:hypothetical protein
MVQPWWVHTAVSAVNVSRAVRATRKFPALACTSAAFPTEANGELESTVTVTLLLADIPLSTGIAGKLPPPPDEVGLPPQLSTSDASATNETAWTQNSRQLVVEVSMRRAMSNGRAADRNVKKSRLLLRTRTRRRTQPPQNRPPRGSRRSIIRVALRGRVCEQLLLHRLDNLFPAAR